MLDTKVFIWNVRGANSRARRDAVREFMSQQRASIACLVETKVTVMQPAMAIDLVGSSFDYVCLPDIGLSGGIMIAWCRDAWAVSRHVARRSSLMVTLHSLADGGVAWSLVAVYGPVDRRLQRGFSGRTA